MFEAIQKIPFEINRLNFLIPYYQLKNKQDEIGLIKMF